jgi:hypothetical protein
VNAGRLRPSSRGILRWIHTVFAIPIVGYDHSPFEEVPNYGPATRFVFVPVLAVTGLWMWKGHVVRRTLSKRTSGASNDVTAALE